MRRDGESETASSLYAEAEASFVDWEILKDVVDETIDLTLDHRQSGHPGGSRSKVHILVSALLSGAMRWDLLRPWRPLQDRFVLAAGHAVPVVYAVLAALNEIVRERFALEGNPRFAFPEGGRWALTREDLPGFRRRGGLPGHAEMSGKTLFLKFNTGPSGHGLPAAAGQALALRLAGFPQVKVVVLEGEGGLTAGSSHETKNTAWGLGLSNLALLVDWNDFGIDEQRISSVVPGTPETWFAPYGWRVRGTENGMEWSAVTRAVLEAVRGAGEEAPAIAWFRTRKGRGYGKLDAASHGVPHARHSKEFWSAREPFMERRGVEYEGVGGDAPADPDARRRRLERNLAIAFGVLRRDEALVRRISDRLVGLADDVTERATGAPDAKVRTVFEDRRIYDFRGYPDRLWARPGVRIANKAAFASWAGWINAFAQREHGRPLFIACAADLAESTGIAGFGKGFGDLPGSGRYDRTANPTGSVLPQEITEFTNAGLVTGLATVNLAADPRERFEGYWGACSTYGAFSYLKYGPMRLFSQLAQDSEMKVGKVLWVAGHSGPETAEDSRTHFGIFAPGVTRLFPEGSVVDLHPWEHNEVPVVLGAALRLSAPIVAVHLTRPPIEIPDREALGIPSHFEAARGAYVLRPFAPEIAPAGTVFVQGTSATSNLVAILPELRRARLNVKVVAAISPQLFAAQDPDERERIVSEADRWDSMAVTSRALGLMADWISNPVAADYSLSADRDARWRTGGTVEEVVDEAGLSPERLLEGIERFVRERPERLSRLRRGVEAAARRGVSP